MSTDNPVAYQSAAERILAEKASSYQFAPGITLYAPSKSQAEQMAVMMEEIDVQDNPSEEDVLAVLSVLLGDQFEPVMSYLDAFPTDVYVDLFQDLFTNLLRLLPNLDSISEKVEKAQDVWRAERPDLFDSK